MTLQTYRKMRDFGNTPEPGGKAGSGAGNAFVIQKHDARRLHYDLRLQIGGALASWAVTRGPSLIAADKRLAVRVEDHPLDYGDFEGTIPAGNYGAGTVLVWDRGTWEAEGDPLKGLEKGHLEFSLSGEKLAGRWHLVRMARKPREKRENWLLIKSEDEHARAKGDPDILSERPESVKTGRTLDGVAAGASPVPGPAPRGARKAALPQFIEPQLATLRRHAPTGDDWLHEIKFDGYRLQARIDTGKVTLLTRSGLDWTARFGSAVAQALAALPVDQAILDGEIVVEGAGGASDFAALQADLSGGRDDRFRYVAFDLLYRDGRDLRGVALLERKQALQALLSETTDPLRYSEHFEDEGEMVLRHACRLRLEGVISKRVAEKYRSGRGRDWIKSKCAERQEMVIGGYVPATTSDSAIGSLVLGVYEDGKLRHVGRAGTGYSREVAEDLFRRLSRMERKRSPFSGRLDAAARRGVVFVKPELVAEVEFRDWTGAGMLRHAAFRGLREDKPAREVVQEQTAQGKAPARPVSRVKLTHPDRVYWPGAGVTKEGVAHYYADVWRFMAPHVINRPLALLRCPQGIAKSCFFQKHAWRGMNREILTLRDPKDDKDATLIAIDTLDGLIGLVQGGALEIHPWQAATDALEKPDQLIIDLDPGDGVEWPVMLDAAQEVRQRLSDAGLAAFVKTTGGKGLHVAAPLQPRAGWDAVKGFARDLAQAMEADNPDRFIAKSTKSARKGRIYVDYLRNGRGATAIAPYSTRAREGATVSMPLGWEELGPAIGPDHFTVTNARARLSALESDPWAGFRDAAAPLEARKPRRRG
ncbi:DNA ligase D [Pararhodobacter sp.]|uniref:DNA ligase D n=1 Tax=Pararhodobacter sp. TaxID=2127056 RepID=UPI002FDD1E55